MFLSDLFDQLAVGELSQLCIGDADGIGIQACDYAKILPHINLGLLELYKRFPLRAQEVIIQQYDQIQLYELNSKYAVSNTESLEPIKYIMDSEYQPFKDNVLKIEKVFNEQGEELYLNDFDQYWSYQIQSYNTIQVPYPEKENAFVVTYRAGPDKIELTGLNPSIQEVPVPPAMLDALLYFIGSRVYSNMNSDNNAEGNNYMQKFELACKKIEELNLVQKRSNENLKLDGLGWV